MLLKKYFWLINLVLITILVWAAVNLVLTVVTTRLEVHSGQGAHISNLRTLDDKGVPPLTTYDPIVNNNIFNPGVRPAAASPDEEKVSGPANEKLPVTKLNLLLKGTAVRIPDNESLAVIYNRTTRKQGLYRVGAAIEDAVIESIQPDRVILKRGQRKETLFLSRERVQEKASVPSRVLPTRTSGSPVHQTAADNYVLDREQVTDMISNINQFMTQLRVRPHFVQGKPAGYLVTDIKKGSLIEQIGLKNGDVLKSVNGTPITKPDQAFAAYQQLLDESQITLELQRGRRSQVITYELK